MKLGPDLTLGPSGLGNLLHARHSCLAHPDGPSHEFNFFGALDRAGSFGQFLAVKQREPALLQFGCRCRLQPVNRDSAIVTVRPDDLGNLVGPGFHTIFNEVAGREEQEWFGCADLGVILLIGIVKKNGIMLVDFAIQAEREEGLSSEDAIVKAAQMRFRAILMTTMAALLGGLPLAIGHGAGSELRQPFGYAIVGGLLVSQLLTLYTTPVIYLLLDKLRNETAGQISARPADQDVDQQFHIRGKA